MNVLQLTTYPHGGAGIACQRLTSALRVAGLEVDLLTMDQLSWKWPFYAERLSFLPFERDKSVRFSFSLANFGHDLSRHPAVKKADLLHLHWINQGFLSLKNLEQLSQLGKPIVWTLHDMWAFTGGCHYSGTCQQYLSECGQCPYLRRPGPNDLANRIWNRKKQQYPSQIEFITCSAWLAQIAQRSALLRDYSIRAIPNPIDTNIFIPSDTPARLAFKKANGIREDAFLLLFVAMKVQEERKGFKYLREALKILKKQTPNLPLELMVLGRANPSDLEDLPYQSHLLGSINDPKQLATIYASADLFVIPSIEDNLPNTVMEALACGTPVVGFQTGGIPEMVEHRKSGFIAPQSDSGAFAEGIHWLSSLKPEAINTIRQNARLKVETDYSYTTIAKRHIALYQELLSRKG